MTVETSSKKVVLLILRGETDIEDIIALKDIITSFVEREQYFFLLDFTNVSHINVSGIEYLNERKERVRSLGGDLKIFGATDYVKNLFTYAGYWGEIDFYGSEEEAIASFEGLI